MHSRSVCLIYVRKYHNGTDGEEMVALTQKSASCSYLSLALLFSCIGATQD